MLAFWLILIAINFGSMSCETWRKMHKYFFFSHIEQQTKAAKHSLELACFQNWLYYIFYPDKDLVATISLCL